MAALAEAAIIGAGNLSAAILPEGGNMEGRWRDPEAPWWAKLRRAQAHISEVQERVSALQEMQPWSIQREPTGPDGWAYRFKVHRPIPADLSAAVGDAVANMCAALDYVAYELACHHVGTMSDSEEAVTAFPICKDRATFDQFFTAGKKGSLRAKLYGDDERRALQCVQPFALTDEMRAVGVEPATDTNTDLLTDHAYGLNTLWNIDKHRRLPGLAWALEGPVWFSGDATGRRWVKRTSERAALHDGIVLSELHGPQASGRPLLEPKFTIDLVLTDDPSPYPCPLGGRLERLHQSLTCWVVPRVFIVADGNPPPILIIGG
jgi:hypothetical protein